MDTEPVVSEAPSVVQEMSTTPEGAVRGDDVLPDNIACCYICNMHKMASYLACPGTMCQGSGVVLRFGVW
jgi:hypothetical protein